MILDISQNHWLIQKLTQEIFLMFDKMKHLVDSYKLFEKKENHEKESLSTIQCQFKIGLALCVSKNAKWLTSDQK